MHLCIRARRMGLIGLALLGALAGVTHARAQSVTPEETVRSVRRMLERLPYYGVFDFIAFGVNRGTVTLVGYANQGTLKADAEMATKRAGGVDEVANKIEVLPTSPNDDRIRWATFYRIYTDDFLSRYAPGGPHQVLRELRDARVLSGHAAGRHLLDPHHREERPHDAAGSRRQPSGPPGCRSARARGVRRFRGAEWPDRGRPRAGGSVQMKP
jgi:hypothetical protein